MKLTFNFMDAFNIVLKGLIVVVAFRAVIEGKEFVLQALYAITVCSLMLSALTHYSLSSPEETSCRTGHQCVPWVTSAFCVLTADILWVGNIQWLAVLWLLVVFSDISLAWRIINLPPVILDDEEDTDF